MTSTAPTLTKGQAIALFKIYLWLQDKESMFFYLNGVAGTGKTFVMKELIEAICERGNADTCTIATPTNKAKNLYMDLPVASCTLNALFGVRMFDLGETLESSRFANYESIKDLSLVIVDEAPMVTDFFYSHIKKAAAQCNTKFLFVGDYRQLTFDKDGGYNSVFIELSGNPKYCAFLDEVVRQASSNPNHAIYKSILEKFGSENQFSLYGIPRTLNGAEGYIPADYSQFLPWFIRANPAKPISQGIVRILCYTNAGVDSWNEKVRAALSYQGVVCKGEMLIGYSNVPDAGIVNGFNYYVVDVGNRFMKDDIYVMKVTLSTYEGKSWDIDVLDTTHPISVEKFYDRLRELSLEAKKIKEHNRGEKALSEISSQIQLLKSNYVVIGDTRTLSGGKLTASLKFGYAETVHKSQGNTYKACFIDYPNLCFAKGMVRDRLVYTAMTRASLNVALIP